jgi:hypothetical protein
VKAFSQFGAEMVELAHLTGDRQNDLKDERRRAQMAAARQVLERSTMMLLTSSKVRSASWNPDMNFCANCTAKFCRWYQEIPVIISSNFSNFIDAPNNPYKYTSFYLVDLLLENTVKCMYWRHSFMDSLFIVGLCSSADVYNSKSDD